MNHFLAPFSISDFGSSVRHEWVETNGLGGYSSSTILCANTRRYHGLLVAALKPPVERVVLLSKLDETLILNNERYEFGVNEYQGGEIDPHGHYYLQQFRKTLFPEFIYQMNFIRIKKTIVTIHHENTVLVIYQVLSADQSFTLELKPLLAPRDFHALQPQTPFEHLSTYVQNQILQIKTQDSYPDLYISAPRSTYNLNPDWYHNFEYREELSRGQDAYENLYTPGTLHVEMSEGMSLGVIVSTENPEDRNALTLFEKEKKRRLSLIRPDYSKEPFIANLRLSADQFLVKRDNGTSILAGYHWFSDWGRDTMISLPGLCLATEEFETARNILKKYAEHVSEGMLPNRFSDYGEAPEYNNADATLWFFVACYQYLQATNDWEFVTGEILPIFKEILWWHDHGTRFQIHAKEDGLLYAGEDGIQISWMDAKVDEWVVTPRIGKAVEINALWYNAWKIYGILQGGSGNEAEAHRAFSRANVIRTSFLRVFWNADLGCLYDYVNGDYKDPAIRPNQLFAISLPFMLLDMTQAKSVLRIVEQKLYTRVGLRSLSPDDPDYQPHYQGDQYSRDGAYHQGVVWSWLLGPFVDALIKVKGNVGRKQALTVIENIKPHLSEAGIGSISEIFEGEPPFEPKGCVAQAWGVAELLRVIHSYHLYQQDPYWMVKPEQETITMSKAEKSRLSSFQ